MLRDDTMATRASLLDRLKDREDQASWQEFFDTYWRLIYTVASKAGLSDAEAQDIVQETVISVANNVGEYLAKHRVEAQLAAEARQIEERLSQPRHSQSRKGSTER